MLDLNLKIGLRAIFCKNGTVVRNFGSKGAQIFSFRNIWCLTMSELRWQKDTSQIALSFQIWACQFLVFFIKSLGEVIFLTRNIDDIYFLLVSFIGPNDFGGWSYRFTHVRSFVCPEFFSETVHRIALIFCMKLVFSRSKKVTKPKFQKKNFGQILAIWAQISPNSRFLVNYSSLNH